MVILKYLSGLSNRQKNNAWPLLAEKDLLQILSSLARFWKGRELAEGRLCRSGSCISHTVVVASQGVATITVTIFYSRTTVPHPNPRKWLSLELPLVPCLWLSFWEVRDQLGSGVMLCNGVSMQQSPRVLYNSTKTCSAPQRLDLIDLEQGPRIVLKANHKTSGCC